MSNSSLAKVLSYGRTDEIETERRPARVAQLLLLLLSMKTTGQLRKSTQLDSVRASQARAQFSLLSSHLLTTGSKSKTKLVKTFHDLRIDATTRRLWSIQMAGTIFVPKSIIQLSLPVWRSHKRPPLLLSLAFALRVSGQVHQFEMDSLTCAESSRAKPSRVELSRSDSSRVTG